MDKNLARHLPRDRPLSEVEAAFSLSLDYDCENKVTVSGYASRWGWSRKRVDGFLRRLGVIIQYPKNTSRKQNQKGQIALQIRNRSGTDKEQIRFIDSRDIKTIRDRSGTDKEQIRDRSGSTTINPISYIPNPVSKEEERPPAQNPKCQPIFDRMRKALSMSDHEINSACTTCSEPERLTEAVQCAIEFDQDLRTKQNTALSDPVAYIRNCYNSGKQSAKTRFERGDNQPTRGNPKKRERSLAELKADAIYHEDGRITLPE